MADKKKPDKRRKKPRPMAEAEREKRDAPPPAKTRPQVYRFNDWASI